ncbi:sugar ABC transporter ATP-binding protein [Halomonas sp. ATBC28]|uniref:sugar ABC transporter ATP-binding protein n=1 Tax=Halomonadaceae TaxID=28256 RepID=UPI00110D5496|nr:MULTISPECIES: sugar ABC transporter ATP-binding protein [Halomonas]MCE7521044.1 sugar ABC transporter ATP-binding protein [Halomonas titanicae]TMU23126.1 sugar ABC transporter ATP-binding protein [Halomonas sp. ATBC28]
MSADHETVPGIEVQGLTKAYGPTLANSDVTFKVAPGSAHALLGENGAGKSTTMKLLSGLIRPDSGEIRIHGQLVTLNNARDAHARGIQTAFQELTLIPDLTVLDNMLLPRAPWTLFGTLNRTRVRHEMLQHFAALELDIDPDALASELNLATRQKIEIARALSRNPSVLLLDEPTSALSGEDVEWLGRIIAGAKARGITVLFISHRLPEVRAFCDTMTILRNGKSVYSARVDAVTDDEVVELIIGRSVENAFPPRRPVCDRSGETPVLATRGLSAGPKLRELDLSLHKGEIVGIAGLQGMGQESLFPALFGEEIVTAGRIELDGKTLHLRSAADALDPSVAIGMVPEERKTGGLFLKLSGRQNATLPALGRFHRGLLLNEGAEARAAAGAFAAVEVDERAHYMPAGAFSGGNQQKIVIAKWLVAQSRILLLFDPTRGIDVGTKEQLYALFRAFTDAGGAVLFHSTEIPELVHLCDRVGVLYEGRLASWLEGETLTENAILQETLGGVDPLAKAAVREAST